MAGITLAQLAQVSKDPIKKYMGMQLIRESKILTLLPFENVSGLKVQAYWWETLPTGGAFRQVNGTYTSYEDGQLGDGTEFVYGFGGDITYDVVLEKIKDVIGDPIQLQVDARVKSMGITWTNQFINGDVATEPNGFNGLKKRVAGMNTRQTVYAAASNAAPLDPTVNAASARGYINKFEKARRYCNAGQVDAIIANENMQIGLAHALSYLQSQGNYLKVTEDQFGREVTEYKGIPLVDPGMLKDQSTEIITETEVAGDAGTDSTSIYFVSFNKENGVYGIQLSDFNAYQVNGGNELATAPQKMYRVDWWNGIASFGRHGIVRMRNISALAGWTEG